MVGASHGLSSGGGELVPLILAYIIFVNIVVINSVFLLIASEEIERILIRDSLGARSRTGRIPSRHYLVPLILVDAVYVEVTEFGVVICPAKNVDVLFPDKCFVACAACEDLAMVLEPVPVLQNDVIEVFVCELVLVSEGRFCLDFDRAWDWVFGAEFLINKYPVDIISLDSVEPAHNVHKAFEESSLVKGALGGGVSDSDESCPGGGFVVKFVDIVEALLCVIDASKYVHGVRSGD